jgi:cytochrome c5
MKKSILTVLVASIGFAGISVAAEKASAINGAELLEKRCSVCHASDKPKAAKKSKDQWDATVTRMMGKGAKLSADEKKALVEHLSKTYKP